MRKEPILQNDSQQQPSLKYRNASEIYDECVSDLLGSDTVKAMSGFVQHRNVTCLDHCISVSYFSCNICRFLKLDWRSAARGALLHDLFLYDWHDKNSHTRMHAFSHPSIALKNAEIFELNDTEKDIIKKHMWPLTVVPPLHREAWVVSCVDKFCAFSEAFGLLQRPHHYINFYTDSAAAKKAS